MAKTSNRKINIWINGKQVENSVRDIRNGMRKLVAEQARMTIGSKEYIEQSKKIKQLQGIMDKHNQALGRVKRGWAKVKEEIKTIATGNIVSNVFTGIGTKIAGAFRTITSEVTKFQKGLTNAFTLLGQNEIAQFGGELKQGALDISELGLAIDDVNQSLFDTISSGVDAGEAIGFMETSAKLAIGGVTDLSIATDGLTTVVNSFKLETNKADEVANAFFTAQKFGKTNVEELSQSIGRAAPIAASLGISYKELLSAGSALTLGGIKTKESFTFLKATFSNLIKPSKEAEKVMRKLGIPVGATEVKAMGFTKTLELLNEAIKKSPDEVGKFITSTEALTAVQALSGKGLEKYKIILNAVTNDIGENSSLSKAYAMQQETLAQSMARAAAKTKVMAIQIGEKLTPFIKDAILLFTGLTKKIMQFVDWIVRNIKTIGIFVKLIGVATVAILSYNAAVKLSVFWTNSIRSATLKKLIIDKANIIITKTQEAVTLLYSAAQALLSGNITKASKAMKAFNLVTKTSPIGLIVGLIGAAVTAYVLFNKELTKAQKTQKLINDLHAEAAKSIAKEKSELGLLLIVAKDETRSKKEREAAIKSLNEISPEYLGNITLENINTKEATKAVDAYIAALKRKALAQAANNKLTKINEELIDLELNKNKTSVSMWQMAKNAVLSYGNVVGAAAMNAADASDNYTESRQELLDTEKQLQEFMLQNELIPELKTDTQTTTSTTNNNINTTTDIDTKEVQSKYDEYLKAYQNFQKQLKGFQEKYYLDGLTQHEKEREELRLHWNQVLSAQQTTIDALESLGKERTKKETKLLNNLYTQRANLLLQRTDEELALEKKHQQELLKAKQDARAKIDDVLISDKDREIKNAKEKYNALIELAEKYGFDTVELYDALKASLAAIDEKYKISEEPRDPFFGLTESEWGDFHDNMDNLFSSADQLNQIWSSYNNLRRQQDEAELGRIQENYDKRRSELDTLVEHKIISERLYNQKVVELDKKTDNEKKKILREQAAREKNQKLFEAAISTAAAIAKALPNIPLSIAVGILGGLQIAAIAAEPLPKLAKGARINSPTTAIIGEAGPEIVFSNKMITDPETGPVLNYLADIQEGKKPKIGSYAMPNYSGMKKAIGRSQVQSQSTGSNYVQTTQSQTQINDLLNENKMLNEKFDTMIKLWSDPNFRIKASLNNDEFKQFQEDDAIGKAMADI